MNRNSIKVQIQWTYLAKSDIIYSDHFYSLSLIKYNEIRETNIRTVTTILKTKKKYFLFDYLKY